MRTTSAVPFSRPSAATANTSSAWKEPSCVAITMADDSRSAGGEDRSQVAVKQGRFTGQPPPGDPQRRVRKRDRELVTLAVGLEPVRQRVVAVAVKLDDQRVVRVVGVDLVSVPVGLERRDREATELQERFEGVLEDAAARGLLGIEHLGGARAQRVQARQAVVGEVAVAAGFVDRAGQLVVGQAPGDVGDRPGDGRDPDPLAVGDVAAGQGGRAVRADPGPLVLDRGADLGDRRPFAQLVEGGGGIVGQSRARSPHARTAASARAAGVRLWVSDGVHLVEHANQPAGAAAGGDRLLATDRARAG